NKDFLSDVFNFRVKDITYNNCEQSEFVINRLDNNVSEYYINKYELMHLINKYMISKGCVPKITIYSDTCLCRVEDYDTFERVGRAQEGKDEFEAVYKAGLWVWDISDKEVKRFDINLRRY